MRSRRSGPGRPLGDTKESGRRVTCKAPVAHLEEGSGRSKTSPTAILQGTHSLVDAFYEVQRTREGCSLADAPLPLKATKPNNANTGATTIPVGSGTNWRSATTISAIASHRG